MQRYCLLALTLDAYRIGRGASVGRAVDRPQGRDEIEALIDASVTRRRQAHGSALLDLERLHEEYRMDGSPRTFARAYRHHHPDDIHEADRCLRARQCLCDVKRLDRYFAAILRRVATDRESLRRKQRQQILEAARRRRDEEQFKREQAQLRANPDLAVFRGLRMMAGQWRPDKGELLMDGRGMPYIDLRRGLIAIRHASGAASCRDHAQVLWTRWEAHSENVPPPARIAVRAVLDALLDEVAPVNGGFTAAPLSLILPSTSPPDNSRSSPLRN